MWIKSAICVIQWLAYFKCSFNICKLLLSCFGSLALLTHVRTSRTISPFRCSHDITTEVSKSGRMRCPKSFTFHSLSSDKPEKVQGPLSGLNPCTPILAPASAIYPRYTFPAGFLRCSGWQAVWEPWVSCPRGLWASVQYDDPQSLPAHSGHVVSICYMVSQRPGTKAAG